MGLARTAVAISLGLLVTGPAASQDTGVAVWAQSGADDALRWSGAKSDVHGLLHSNGGISVTGSKNRFTGGTSWVASFNNNKDSGPNANTFDPAPAQVSTQPWPRQYSLDDYMPGGAAAIAAGAAYVDLSDECAASGAAGVSFSFVDEVIPGRLYWAPCDVSVTATNTIGEITVVATGKVHLNAHGNSQLAPFSSGILALSSSDRNKAIHLNGNKSELLGDLIAEFGEIHVAGSQQTLTCGVFANTVKVSGSSLAISGADCSVPIPNNPPLAVDDAATTPEDTAVEIAILANDSDIDGQLVPSSVEIVVSPASGSVAVDAVSGNATYQPAPDFFGTDSFAYTVADDDGARSQPATVTIGVADSNDPPTASDDQFSTDEDIAAQFDVLLNDVDIDGALDPTSVMVVNAPLNATTTVDAVTGVITYTPDPDFFGDDQFSYTVRDDDGAESQPAIATVTVGAVNDPPVAQPDVATVAEDNTVQLDVLANDSDVDDVLMLANIVIDTGPANGTLTFDSVAGTLTYTPNADFFGSDSFEYSLIDGGGAASAGSALVSITVDPVNDAPVADDASVSVAEDNALSVLLVASDVEGDPINYAVVDAPIFGALSGVAPDLTYTPEPNFFGTDTFTFSASDGLLGSNVATVTVTVTPVNDLPIIVAETFPAVEDTTLDLTLNASDVDGDALTIDVTVPPQNGTVTGTGLDLAYVPDADFNGTDVFTVVASDGTGFSDPATITVEVAAVNDAPVADGQLLTTPEDVALALTLSASDVDGDSLTFVVQSQPAGGALTGTAPDLTYTPDPDFNGDDSFTFIATDGLLDSVPATIQVSVTAENDAPIATAQSLATDEDVTLAVTLSGGDVDGDPLTFSVVSGPASGAISGSPPDVVYTPAADFNGSDSFAFVANDGTVDSAPAQIDITVAAINDPPVASDLDVATDEDTPVSIVLAGSDVDGDPLTFALQQAPANGTLGGAAPNLSYTPNADFSGADSFTYVANDGAENSAPATVSIVVNAVNDAPTAIGQSVTTDEDTPVGILLAGNDPEGAALTFTVITPPGSGSLSGTAPDLTYTPGADFSGSDGFTFIVSDGLLDSAPATVSITVNALDDAPVADPQAVVTDEDTAVAIILTGFDPEGAALSFRVTAGPASGSLSGTAPNLTYTPNADFSGTDSLAFVVNDGAQDSQAATVSITVNAVNDPPEADPLSLTTAEDTPVAVTLTGTDAEGAGLSFNVATGPANGTLSGTAPNLTYTPGANFFGADSFTFVVNDGAQDSAPATVSIDVTPVNDAPVATSVTIDAIAGQPVAVTLAGRDDDSDDLTFSIVTQPGNGVLSGPVTDLFYTADPGFSGVDQFTFVANDGTVDSAPATVTLQVTDSNDPPTITSSPITQATRLSPYSYQVVADDADGDALAYFLSTAPAGMTITAGGLIEWQPDTVGQFDVVVDVSDGNGGLAQQAFTIDVVDNSPPEFTRIPLLNAPLGETYRGTGAAIDPDGGDLTFALTAGPAGSTLIDLGNGEFRIEWLSAGSIGDTTPFTVTATDPSGASSTLNLAVVITGDRINRSHLGTDFWLAFGINFRNFNFGLGAMPATDPGRQLQVVIGAPDGATGTVEVPGVGIVEPFTIAPGGSATVDLPTGVMAGVPTFQGGLRTPSGLPPGVHVVSDLPVTVAAVNWAFATTDAWLALPTNTHGTDYLVSGFRDDLFQPNNDDTFWAVLATQDNTTFTVTPLETLPLRVDQTLFDPQTFTLNRGEFRNGVSRYGISVEIVADQPVAVFAGSGCADVPLGVGTCDHLWQQFVPTTTLASEYLAAPLATRTASLYRVIASEDDTRVFVNGVYSALLNRGEFFEPILSGPVSISASRPITAIQYATGNQFDTADRMDDLADPFMLNLAPVDTFLADYTVVVPSGEGVFRDQPNNIVRLPIENHYLSLVIPAAAADSLYLDGSLVDTTGFEPIPSSNYLAGALPISSGTHNIAAGEQFGVTVYGFGLEESYGFYAGLIFPDGSTNLQLDARGPAAPLVAGSDQACIDVTVRDLGGARVPRARYTLDIVGTVPRSHTGFTDRVGDAQFCYTQSAAGIDTVTVGIAGDSAVLQVDWLPNDDPATNGAPDITSFPDLVLYEQTFVYPITYVDPDGDTIALSLSEAPNGATIANDALSWTPPIPADREPTTHLFTLRADDGNGGIDEQRFELKVFYPAIFVERFPMTRATQLFSGRYETTFGHLGGDPLRLVANMVEGPGRVFWAGILGTTPVFNIDGRPQFIDVPEYTDEHNLMCRSEGTSTGQFSLTPIWQESGFGIIRVAVGGPVYDSNADGFVTDADDIYAAFAESDGINLYDLSTRQIVWRTPVQSFRQANYMALANVDGDSSQEVLAVVGLPGDTLLRLTAFDDDGTVLWRSGHDPLTREYTGSTFEMPVLPVDLDNDGSTEILLGPYVYDNQGNLLWQFDDTRIGSTRPRYALPLAVDLDGDGLREVLFQNEVRDTDGTLLWSLPYPMGTRRPQVFYAVGDLDPNNSTLEIAVSASTENGVVHEAFDASGQSLWPALTGIDFAVPVIADFDRDGDVEIFAPDERTMISADGEVQRRDGGAFGFNILQPITDLDRDGIPERLSFSNSWILEASEVFSTQRWTRLSFRNQTNGFSTTRLWQSALFLDVDHDGNSEMFTAGVFGAGLFEAAGRPLPSMTRRYSQVVDFDQPVIGFDTEFGTPQSPGLADAWVGRITLSQIDEQNFTLSAEVRNKGLAPINTPVTVRFYGGRTDTGTLLGERTLSDLPVSTVRTVSIPIADTDLDVVMSAELVLDPSVVQCDDRNETVEGERHTIELRDGDTPYRIRRYSYLHQLAYSPLDIGFLSAPTSTSIELGQTYVFDIDAGWGDPSSSIGNSIIYLPDGPTIAAGVSVNSFTGEVQWTPTFADVGANSFTVIAESVNDTREARFTIDVVPRANEVPVITSAPPTGLILTGQTFAYDVDATDADGDTLTYALDVAPFGMTIDPVTGAIAWTPGPGQVGLFPVTVSVDDAFGGIATQSFSVQVGVTNNTPPDVTSIPPFTAKATFLYQYQVVANDVDGDFLTYTVETGPSGMTIDGSGLLSWTPPAAGVESVVIRVSDGQAFVDQGWTLQISDAAVPLEASLFVNPAVADLNSTVELTVGFSGAAGPVNISLTVDGVAVPVDASGMATVVADSVGVRTATAIVSDPFASDSATVTYTVIDPNATSSPPVVSLVAPDFEQEVTAPIDAIGTIDDPDDDLLSWFLALQARGADPTEFTTIASGTTEIPNDVIGRIDPTMLLNGLYSVILQATDAAGNVSQDVRVIRVTGDLKVGNFSITFEDFSAPVAGIPVTVLRTYDTRQRTENLDFGFGWTVDYQNVRLQESRDIGFSWNLIEEDLGFFSQWCVRPNGDPTVTVRLPDGEVESFVARAEPECTQFVPTIDVNIVFDPIDGTDSTLEQVDFGLVRIVGTNIVDLGAPGEPIDPDAYVLTMPDGTVFELDQNFGIRRVIDSNDNSLTYTDAGVIHSQGFSLDFVRDGEGRITDIVAPDGTSLTYEYDANGDLIAFTDQVSNRTQFTYTNATDHYLEDIIDPRGIPVSRNEYDADGRLIAIIDANGNRIEYTHDIDGRTETVRDRRGNPTIYIYDDEGNVLTEINALGETINRTYDEDRNVLSMTDGEGNTTSWTYDERGNQLTESDALTNTTTSTYDDRNLLLTQVDPLGNPIITNVYDTRNTNLLTTTDVLGNTTTFFWDTGIGGGCSTGASRGSTDALLNRTTIQPRCVGPFADLPAWEEDARGVRTTFLYDDLGRRISETTVRTDENGIEQILVTTMEYDDKGRIARLTDAEGNVTQTEYNPINQSSAIIDANLSRTEFDYDARGNLVETRFPDGTSEATGYDEEGNVISQTNRLGRVTRMAYDAANRLIETIYPDDTPGDDTDNPRTTNAFDRAGRLTATIDERGNRTEYEYDAANRRVLVRDALLQETRFEYDARGLRTAMIDTVGRRTEYRYDAAGRLIETVFPDETPADDTDNLRSVTGYDAVGRRISETDLAGSTTTFEYDEVGNLVAVIDALAQRTQYAYDERSNKISQTDAELRTTIWTYDNVGRVVSRTLPEGQIESFSYDGNGNRTGHVDFNGASHTFVFDALNREISSAYADGVTVTTSYTGAGQVATVTDDRGTTSYTYDERDRLNSITYPTGKSIDYGYDATGNRISVATQNQLVIYSYDVLNRLGTVTDDAGTTTYDYDPVHNITGVEYANGTRAAYVYDALDRLTELSQFDINDVLFDRHTYTLAPNGNRLQHAELSGRVVNYIYDGLNRLVGESVVDPLNADRDTIFDYDSVGNRLTEETVVTGGTTSTSYVYDNNDRLITETRAGTAPTTISYTYDNNGNTLSRLEGALSTVFAYDSRNRLTDFNNGQTTYRYDANGIRQSETTGGLTTNYLVDPNRRYAQVIEESFDLNAAAEIRFTYGHDLLYQHRRIDATTSEYRAHHYDGIGSTRELTDSSGNVTDTYAFTAFGEIEGRTGITPNDYLFAGEQFDESTGFYYLRARYYDPRIARFRTMDTFSGRATEPITLHKYLYANANPIIGIDPSGRATDILQLSAGLSARAILLVTAITVASINIEIKAKEAAQVRAEARTCAAQHRGKAVTDTICRRLKMPILFHTETRIPNIFAHVLQSQGLGQPSTLRRTLTQKLINRGIALGKCALGLALNQKTSTNNSCDEYPFASTFEGGTNATTKYVPLTEQWSQGGTISSFYSACSRLPDIPFKNEFVVIPVISAPTGFQCNLVTR